MDIVKIKCPHCGAVLSIKWNESLENKSVLCPACNTRSKYVDFKQPNSERNTDNGRTRYDEDTDLGEREKRVGRLLDMKTRLYYELQPGMNSIGRKSDTSQATVQIKTDDRCMSRIHANIEVMDTTKGYVHVFSNAINKNPSYINGLLVEQGDGLVLNNGDKIKMAETTLMFVLGEK